VVVAVAVRKLLAELPQRSIQVAVAEVLEIPPERIRVIRPDSLASLPSNSPVGSRMAIMLGGAAVRAAQKLARRNLDAFPADVDAILTNAAGCGSAMHEYHLILRGTPDEARAEAFKKRVMDVSVFLARLGLRDAPGAAGGARKVAYHDACHLANAQGVRAEPRTLLRAIPGVEVCELPDAHLCCGSAGTYNLDQPETAASLGAQKAKAVIGTGANVVASGNIGCLTQLKSHLAKQNSPVKVRHTMQVLRDAYQAKRP
jgi:glycolate oxidase iron-sulfur subunit